MLQLKLPKLRKPYPPPCHPSDPPSLRPSLTTTNRVSVKHPGYGEHGAVLIAFLACEGPDRDRIAYATLYDACIVLTNNRFDGWLAADIEGKQHVQPDNCGLLKSGSYYFHLPVIDNTPDSAPQIDPHYAILPTFRTWPFPHGQMPLHWLSAGQENSRLKGQGDPPGSDACRLTGHTLKIQRCHVVPSAERTWFVNNNMDQYGVFSNKSGLDMVNKSDNLLPLRPDIHRLWDDYELFIAPRQTDELSCQWAVYASTDALEMLELYHAVPLRSLDCPPEYFFARWAYHVFPAILGFLLAGQQRWLWIPSSDDPSRLVRTLCSVSKCHEMTQDQGRRRGGSPTKRARGDAEQPDVDDIDDHESTRKRRRKSYEEAGSVDSGVAGIRYAPSLSSDSSDYGNDCVGETDDDSELDGGYSPAPADVVEFWHCIPAAIPHRKSFCCRTRTAGAGTSRHTNAHNDEPRGRKRQRE